MHCGARRFLAGTDRRLSILLLPSLSRAKSAIAHPSKNEIGPMAAGAQPSKFDTYFFFLLRLHCL